MTTSTQPSVPAAQQLRQAGLRVTAIRTAVLDIVARSPHIDAEAVRAGVTQQVGSVAVQSVYDALATLRDAGLLRRLEPAGHPARYELDLADNHHHLACRRCGVLVDVACETAGPSCLTPSQDHGFVVDEAEVIFWGTCPACAAR